MKTCTHFVFRAGATALIISVLLSACGGGPATPRSVTPNPNAPASTPPAQQTGATFTTDAFSIQYPPGWTAGPCSGGSVSVAHATQLGGKALACLSTNEDRGTACTVSFRGSRDSAEIDAAYETVYQEGTANHAWRVDSKQPVTVDGRQSREVIFQKPHGEPYYAVRDVWVPVNDGVYLLTCLTYANSYRRINGARVALEDLYAPAFDTIIQGFHSTGEASPTSTALAANATVTPGSLPLTKPVTPQATPTATGKGGSRGPVCRFTPPAGAPVAGWYWLRDSNYRDEARWECTGLPADAPLPITFTALVTNRSDGGSGYSTPVRVTASHPAGGPEWTAQVYLQNPAAPPNPENSRGAGYPTTGYFALPADYLGAGGTLQLRVGRLAPEAYHVAVNDVSLHFDTPRPSDAYTAKGSASGGWTWLRDSDRKDYGEWRFSGLEPGVSAVLALDLLVTNGPNGGAGYSAPIELTISAPAAGIAPQMLAVQAQNLLFAAEPGNSGGRGYQAYGSLALDPAHITSQGDLVVRLARPLETDRHVAVNRGSVRVVQLDSTLRQDAESSIATATPVPGADQASCEALGGKWGRIGLSPREQCNLPTTDAGKTCLASSACQGVCLADLSPDEVLAAMRDRKVILGTGKCSAWRIVVGCIGMVENGVVRAICVD